MKPHWFAIAMLSLALLAPAHAADAETLEDFYKNPQRMQDVKILGSLLLSLKYPQLVDKHKSEFMKNYWAFKADAKIAEPQLSLRKAEFEDMYRQLAAVIQEYELEQLSFAGVDVVCLAACQDWYFVGHAPKGPILIRMSMEFKDGARIFAIEWFTEWKEVKVEFGKIQMKPGAKVVTITYTPPKDDVKDTEL